MRTRQSAEIAGLALSASRQVLEVTAHQFEPRRLRAIRIMAPAPSPSQCHGMGCPGSVETAHPLCWVVVTLLPLFEGSFFSPGKQ
jgi:hypothetical protein